MAFAYNTLLQMRGEFIVACIPSSGYVPFCQLHSTWVEKILIKAADSTKPDGVVSLHFKRNKQKLENHFYTSFRITCLTFSGVDFKKSGITQYKGLAKQEFALPQFCDLVNRYGFVITKESHGHRVLTLHGDIPTTYEWLKFQAQFYYTQETIGFF